MLKSKQKEPLFGENKNAKTQKNAKSVKNKKKIVIDNCPEPSLEELDKPKFKIKEIPMEPPPNQSFEDLTCQKHSYPGYCPIPKNIAVVGSKTGTFESICTLLRIGFKCADRVLIMTPWGNYVVFRGIKNFFIFDGCTCNVQIFRHLDLQQGTAGLVCTKDLHSALNYILNGEICRKPPCPKPVDMSLNDLCNKYGAV